MPWKARSVMEERLRFVARLLDGETMTDVCREFGISRKTGYKIFDRYKEHGLEALSDRSRRPVRYTALSLCCHFYRGKSLISARRQKFFSFVLQFVRTAFIARSSAIFARMPVMPRSFTRTSA